MTSDELLSYGQMADTEQTEKENNAGSLQSRSKHFITDRLFSTTRFG